MAGRVCIKTYLNKHEAELTQGLLESCGIKTEIVADDAGGMRPELLYLNGARLFVKEEDSQKAIQVLKEQEGQDLLKGKGEDLDDPDSLKKMQLEIKATGATGHLIFGFTLILIGVGSIFMLDKIGVFMGTFCILIGIGSGYYKYRDSLKARQKLKARE